MLHGVCITVIKGEGRLLKSSRECSPFYVACKRWFRELIQCPAHGIVSQAPRRWASAFVPLVMLFFMREGLAWSGSWSLPIVIIAFIIGGQVKVKMRTPLLCMAQFLFKSFISRCMACSLFCLWDTWLPTREWFLLVWVVFTLPSRNLPFSSFRSRLRLGKSPYCWDLAGSGWWEPAWWGPDPTMLDCCPY